MVFDYLGGVVVPNLDKEKENEGGLRKGEKGRFPPQKQAQDVLELRLRDAGSTLATSRRASNDLNLSYILVLVVTSLVVTSGRRIGQNGCTADKRRWGRVYPSRRVHVRQVHVRQVLPAEDDDK